MKKILIVCAGGNRLRSVPEREPNVLPRIDRLMKQGLHGRIARLPGVSSETMWSAIYTGQVDAPTGPVLWEVVGGVGKRVIAINIPTRRTTPLSSAESYASPPDLQAEVRSLIHEVMPDDINSPGRDGPGAPWAQIERQVEVSAKLLQRFEWDLFVTVLPELDRTVSRLPDGRHGPGENLEAEPVAGIYWQHVDQGLDRLLSLLARDVITMFIAGDAPSADPTHSDQGEWGLVALAADAVNPTTRLGRVAATDIAPTVLTLLGVPIPEPMAGRPLDGVVGAADAELTDEERALLEKHLMGLGYLG